MPDLIDYRMEIVGGPFDGADGMRWLDDGEHEPPSLVLVGVCPGDGSCGSTRTEKCVKGKRRHVYYWLPAESGRPSRVTTYELQDSFIEPDGTKMTSATRIPGRAIYAIGGLLLPKGDDLDVELPEDRELETVGGRGGVYASSIARQVCREHGIELGR